MKMSNFWEKFVHLVYRDKIALGRLIIEKCHDLYNSKPGKIDIDPVALVAKETQSDVSIPTRRKILQFATGAPIILASDKLFETSLLSLLDYVKSTLSDVSVGKKITISGSEVRNIEHMRRTGVFDRGKYGSFGSDAEKLVRIVKQFSAGSSLVRTDIGFLRDVSFSAESDAVRSFALNLLSGEMGRCGLMSEARRFNELELSYLPRNGDDFMRTLMSRVHIFYNSLAYCDYGDLVNTHFYRELSAFINSCGPQFGMTPGICGVNIDDFDLKDVLVRIGVPFVHIILFKFIIDLYNNPRNHEDLCSKLILLYRRILRLGSEHGFSMARGIWNHMLPISIYFHANKNPILRDKFINIALCGGDLFNRESILAQIDLKKNRFDHVYILMCILVYRSGLSDYYQEVFFDLIYFVKNMDYINNNPIKVALSALASRDGRFEDISSIDPVAHYVVRSEGFDAVIAP